MKKVITIAATKGGDLAGFFERAYGSLERLEFVEAFETYMVFSLAPDILAKPAEAVVAYGVAILYGENSRSPVTVLEEALLGVDDDQLVLVEAVLNELARQGALAAKE